jgi:hypothetical protein
VLQDQALGGGKCHRQRVLSHRLGGEPLDWGEPKEKPLLVRKAGALIGRRGPPVQCVKMLLLVPARDSKPEFLPNARTSAFAVPKSVMLGVSISIPVCPPLQTLERGSKSETSPLIYISPIMRHTGTLSATPTMVQKA